MTTVAFRVTGTPVPQGSLKSFVTKEGRLATVHSNAARLKPWRDLIVREAVRATGGRPPLTGAVAVTVAFALPRPKYHHRAGKYAHELKPTAPTYPTSPPDLDKLVRAVLDALTMARTVSDDAVVAVIAAGKTYSPTPGCRVEVVAL